MAEKRDPKGAPTSGTCGICGKRAWLDPSTPATACRECGACLLRLPGSEGPLHPFTPPGIRAESAWSSLRRRLLEAGRAELTSSTLLMVPFYDRGRVAAVRSPEDRPEVRLAPAADLLPAGLETSRIGSPRGVRGLSIGDPDEHCRPVDPEGALGLVRLAETVDLMLPPPPGPSRLYYLPFWSLTYRIDHVEHCGVVDAVSGIPVGSSAPPKRWLPALAAAAAGAALFIAFYTGLGLLDSPILRTVLSGLGSWAAALATFGRLVLRERGR